jgi:DNA polymerase-4
MPLRILYVDMNSYFASVEQQLRPELRGKPVVVAAVNTDSTCCIAASYEAKKFGIRTGTPVWEARRVKSLKVVEARPALYVEVHHQIITAIETCLPKQAVHSIDEISCRLSPAEAEPAPAQQLAQQVKEAIYRDVGQYLHCSIGLAPNRFLAKVAADMQKPNGMTTITEADLPHKLYSLELDDIAGIGPRMLKRLNRVGIQSVEQLCKLDESQLKEIWAGVVGQRWWHWLRGHDLHEAPTRKTTIGHSHVLPPELRNEQGAKNVLIRLLHKAAVRLRRDNYWAGKMEIYISFTYREEGWSGSIALGMCQDTQSMMGAFHQLWAIRPGKGRPTQVAITLYDLVSNRSAALPLFPEEQKRLTVSRVADELNKLYGPNHAYFGAMHHLKKSGPSPIAFHHVPELEKPPEKVPPIRKSSAGQRA